MSRRALVLDGLWYSLCPSFTQLALSRQVPLLRPRKRSSRPRSPPAIRIAATPVSQRCYSSHTRILDDLDESKGHSALGNPRTAISSNTEPPSPSSDHVENRPYPRTNESDNASESPAPRIRTVRVYKDLEEKPTSYLEALLQRDKTPNIRATTQVLRALIRDRHVQPRARHYKALILANTDSVRGSPEAVRGLLEEMEDNGITADSGTLHAALQVLAVHPDYLLRQEVLHKLRDLWLPLSPAGWHFVVAGLLREHQFELALEQVALMGRKDIPIENWLHSTMIYHLCDFQEFDEVYRLMRARVDHGHDITLALWMHVLNTASEAQHYVATRYVWQRMVDLGYLHPPADTCSNVLTLAARAGDAEQANSVFRFLTNSELSPSRQDYERLVEANMGAGDLLTAFDVLCTMHEAGIAPEKSSTESILVYMIESKIDRREAWQLLKHLKNAKRRIPIGSVHVIAELCEHDAQDDRSVVDDAVGFYKELYTLCPEGANVQVYNTLIRMCRRAANREAGMFLVKEMASLGVIPNATTFETIILMCLDAGNYRSAYMYFQDLLKRDSSISAETQTEIRQICAQSVDEFALRLQYHPQVQELRVTMDEEANLDPEADSEAKPKGFGRTKLVYKARVAYNKERRKRKRQRQAMDRYVEEHGWPEEEEEAEKELDGLDRGSAKSGE